MPRKILDSWNWFWFNSRTDDNLIQLSLFRFVFSVVMFFCYLARAFDIEFFFGFQGILPWWYGKNLSMFQFHPTIISDSWSVFQIQILHSTFLFGLFLLAVGIFTRPVAIFCYLLHLIFLNRNMPIIFGVDAVASFYFLYLCFANANGSPSLDSYFGWGAKRQTIASHIALRLMQLQLCIVYGFSGLEKLKNIRWWEGTAMWDVFSIAYIQRWDFSFLAQFPEVFAILGYLVLFWEIYFPILVWLKPLRLPILIFGVLMHLGIFIFMNLPSFGFLMISIYILFLKKSELEWKPTSKNPIHN